MRGAGALALVASAAGAEEAPLVPFDLCMDVEVARYERTLKHHLKGPRAEVFEIGEVEGVEFCGTQAIVICDRSAAPLPCQHALAAEQDALAAKVRAGLPAPETVAGKAGEWSDTLYPLLYALARGTSAGPDCAGGTDVMTAWCEAREAGRRLEDAMLAWQLARYLGAGEDAVAAGWARVPPPVRPLARPGDAR